MSYALGRGSREKLARVHPTLSSVVERAILISETDFTVVCGVRTEGEQRAAVARGASNTMNSLHIAQPDGYSHAVDLAPVSGGAVLWKDLQSFQMIADAMFDAADSLGLLIQWGADWDMDGVRDDKQNFVGRRPLFDMPHFQLPRPWNVEAAKVAQASRIALRGKP